MSLKFTAGDLAIHRVIEGETTFQPVHDVFAGLTPDLLAENRQWLRDSGGQNIRHWTPSATKPSIADFASLANEERFGSQRPIRILEVRVALL
jgi:hypothetical protein